MISGDLGYLTVRDRGRSGPPAGGVAVPVDRGRVGGVSGREQRDDTSRGPQRSTTTGSACSGCGNWSIRVHSSYLRFPVDVPGGGRREVLCLRVRRSACPVAACGRRTFVEQVPGLTRKYGRWTDRLRSTLAAVGLALAGRAGPWMAGVFGVSVSRSTVLRLIEALPEPDLPAPRVVGVDEYATRKGRHYGTVVVDVESRRPVDLLPDREASSLAAWLAKRRAGDRGGLPGPGSLLRRRRHRRGTAGSAGRGPLALWHNRSEAAERCVADHRGCLRGTAPEHPNRSRNQKNQLTPLAHRGPPATGSPTGPGPTMPPSTPCWRPATAAVRSNASSG
ncbi:transposase [Streptomyces sp. NPDC008343]|uniref:transposase n=1 Tax=Streptomyces sp. NPDC008343 TaxID=3364828 RepID=UPI0036EE1C4D